MARLVPREAFQLAKPLLSKDKVEAKRRVIALYRSWYRQLPYVLHEYDVPLTLPQLKSKLKEKFLEHKDVQDVRLIDKLVIMGQVELVDVSRHFSQRSNIMAHFKESPAQKPKDFLQRFYEGQE